VANEIPTLVEFVEGEVHGVYPLFLVPKKKVFPVKKYRKTKSDSAVQEIVYNSLLEGCVKEWRNSCYGWVFFWNQKTSKFYFSMD
jgi:hypothetical protein